MVCNTIFTPTIFDHSPTPGSWTLRTMASAKFSPTPKVRARPHRYPSVRVLHLLQHFSKWPHDSQHHSAESVGLYCTSYWVLPTVSRSTGQGEKSEMASLCCVFVGMYGG